MIIRIETENNDKHSEIDTENKLVLIYDEDESEAWKSLFLEALEYHMRKLLDPYLRLINKLVELVEEQAHTEKEKVLDKIVNGFAVRNSCGLHSTNKRNNSPG